MNAENDARIRNAITESPEARGSASARNWVEDAPLENGNYQCRCVKCEHLFMGHKRRMVCKICDSENRSKWNAMTDGEKAEARRKFESDFIRVHVMGQRQNASDQRRGHAAADARKTPTT